MRIAARPQCVGGRTLMRGPVSSMSINGRRYSLHDEFDAAVLVLSALGIVGVGWLGGAIGH